jgi:hypothetical protein
MQIWCKAGQAAHFLKLPGLTTNHEKTKRQGNLFVISRKLSPPRHWHSAESADRLKMLQEKKQALGFYIFVFSFKL